MELIPFPLKKKANKEGQKPKKLISFLDKKKKKKKKF